MPHTRRNPSPGGKGVNVSLVCAALGLSTRALGFIAGGTGALFASLLAETGVEYDFCRLGRGMTRINVKVCAREQTELNGAGPDIPADALEKAGRVAGHARRRGLARSVRFGPVRRCRRIFTPACSTACGQSGVHTLVDASDDALKNALPCAPDLIKPNLEELDALVGGARAALLASPPARASCRPRARRTSLFPAGRTEPYSSRYRRSAPSGRPRRPVVQKPSAPATPWPPAGCTRACMAFSAPEALRFAVAAGSAAAFCGWLPDRAAVEAVLRRTAAPTEIR